MPRGDRTGPAGAGPMTGRGAGHCAGYAQPGFMNPAPGGGGFGAAQGGGFAAQGRSFGAGRGGGFGAGRGGGRGRRNMYYATGLPGWARAGYGVPGPQSYAGAPASPKQEADMLKEEAGYLKQQMDDIQARINMLEKTKGQEENRA